MIHCQKGLSQVIVLLTELSEKEQWPPLDHSPNAMFCHKLTFIGSVALVTFSRLPASKLLLFGAIVSDDDVFKDFQKLFEFFPICLSPICKPVYI